MSFFPKFVLCDMFMLFSLNWAADQGCLQNMSVAVNVQKEGQEALGYTGLLQHHHPKERKTAHRLMTDGYKRRAHHHQQTMRGGQTQQVGSLWKTMLVEEAMTALITHVRLKKMGIVGPRVQWLETMGPRLRLRM